MAARVTRAKKKIAAARHPVPGARLRRNCPTGSTPCSPCVHLVLHHRAHRADRRRSWSAPTWSSPAIDLARMLHALMPDEREATGLLALLLLIDARRGPRTDADGRLLLLEEQDRSRWDPAPSTKAAPVSATPCAVAVPAASPSRRRSRHCTPRPRAYAETDWRQLRRPLRRAARPCGRHRSSPSTERWRSPWSTARPRPWPTVERWPTDPRLTGYHYLPATRADLLRRLGRDRGGRRGLPCRNRPV